MNSKFTLESNNLLILNIEILKNYINFKIVIKVQKIYQKK